jgi:hypothetical protein
VSNYYKSKCCGEQVTPKETIPGIKWNYVCLGCHQNCKVTAMLDTPADKSVKAYQEDIKAGVDVSGVPKEEKPVFTCICGKCKEPTLAETRSALMAMALDKTLGLDDITVAKIINKLR